MSNKPIKRQKYPTVQSIEEDDDHLVLQDEEASSMRTTQDCLYNFNDLWTN